jgi:hypothetical protein
MGSARQTFIAITFADDSVGVMGFVTHEFFADGSLRWVRHSTDEAIASEIARTAYDAVKLPIKGWRRVNAQDIPTDRTFRNAWVDRGSIQHDMPKARALRLQFLRVEREKKWPDLDSQWMRAAGQKKLKEADDIEAKRQALRDFPQTIAAALDAAQDIEALKAIQLPE